MSTPVGHARGRSAKSVFVSYRREDTQQAAGRLAARLIQEFGEHVEIVIDVDTDQVGLDYRTVIAQHLENAEVVLALIGPRFLVRNEDGKLRIQQPNDLVRMELARSLARDIAVIPVLVDGAQLPSLDELPDDLDALVFRGAVELSHQSFEADFAMLADHVANVLNVDVARDSVRENDLGATTQSKGIPSGSGPWMAVAAGLLVVMSLALPWAKLEGSQNGVSYEIGLIAVLISAFAAVLVFIGAAVGRPKDFGVGAIVMAWASAGLLTFQIIDINSSRWSLEPGSFVALFAAVVVALTATYVGSPTVQRILTSQERGAK